MKKIASLFICAFLMILTQNCISQAEDVSVIMDKFHNGLADIIEGNMNSPDRCVAEVDDYYRKNRATIEKVRKMTEKGVKQAMSMMPEYYKKYESMSEEELEALERKTQQMERRQPKMLPGTARYTKALEAFSMKYPGQGIRIATKALEFMPRTE